MSGKTFSNSSAGGLHLAAQFKLRVKRGAIIMAFSSVRVRYLPVLFLLVYILACYLMFHDRFTAVIARRQRGKVSPRFQKKYAEISDVPHPRVLHINCGKLFAGDSKERDIALEYQRIRNESISVSALELIRQTANCEQFKQERQYLTLPVSREEEEFPIAYSILLYKDTGQVERLLRAIYRPQNYYCIHVDAKSPPVIHQSMKQLADCFDNVIIAHFSSDVVWGFYTVVEPEVTCMYDLWKFKKWKYFINLTGQEWPLKTNLELVKILKIYNGANDIPGISLRRLPVRFLERVQYERLPDTPIENRLDTPKQEFPLWLNYTKGTVHVTATRGYIDFLLHDPMSYQFMYWLNNTFVPDECYFSTLNHNPMMKVPGSYTGGWQMSAFTMNRYKIWKHTAPCKGRFVRYICIPGLGDLPALAASRELFLNKVEDDYQHLVTDCMEELHYNRTRLGILGHDRVAPLKRFYESLPFVKYARRDITSFVKSEEEMENWRNLTVIQQEKERIIDELQRNMTNGTDYSDDDDEDAGADKQKVKPKETKQSPVVVVAPKDKGKKAGEAPKEAKAKSKGDKPIQMHRNTPDKNKKTVDKKNIKNNKKTKVKVRKENNNNKKR